MPRIYLLVLALLLGSASVLAQPDGRSGASPPPSHAPRLGMLEIERMGVPGIAIAQDAQGFLWFGGHQGLFRYDGHRPVPYAHVPEDPTSLSSSRLEVLYVDRRGTLWVGAFGGLNRYDPERDHFTRFLHDPGDPASLPQDTVTALLEDSRGNFWVGTHGGLSRLDRETGHFVTYRHDPDDPSSLSNDQVRVIYEDRQGTLWVGTGSPEPSETRPGEGGLNRFDRETETFTRYRHDPDDERSLVDSQIMALLEDSRGTFWVGTRGDGLHVMDRAAGTFRRLRHDPRAPARLSRPLPAGSEGLPEDCQGFGCGGVSFLHEDRSGVLWVGALLGGLTRYDLETGEIRHERVSPDGFGETSFWRIHESDDGTFWIGTWSRSYRVVPQRSLFRHHDLGTGEEEVEPLALHEDGDGTLWVGTSAGLGRWNPKSGRFDLLRHDETDPARLPPGPVMSIYRDPTGVLWVGGRGYVARLDRATGRFTRYAYRTSWTGSPIDGSRSIRADHEGHVWVGTINDGLFRLDPASGRFTSYRERPGDPKGLSSNAIRVLHVDSAAVLWIGTTRGGLLRLDGETDTFTRHLAGTTVTAIREDRAGRLWLTTLDGLHRFDRETGTSTRFAWPENAIDFPMSIVEDGDGKLWIGTSETDIPVVSRGSLLVFDPGTRTFGRFGRLDGLGEAGFHPGSALRGRDGVLHFGSRDGLLAFHPRAVEPDRGVRPRVVLTSLRVFNEEVVPGPGAPLSAPIHVADEIRLTHDRSDFTIDYAALSFREPEGTQYAYRLEPHDRDWVGARGQRSARYSGLGPGTYTFRVRAVDAKGVWSDETVAIRVVILPPWWRTWPAYLVYGLLFAAGVVAVDRARRRRVVRREQEAARQRELEQKREIERAYLELRRAKDRLVQQEKLASLGALTAGIAHEIKNPLNFVNNFASLSKELLQEIRAEAEENPEVRVTEITEDLGDLEMNVTKIEEHGRRADGIVRSMLEHSRGGKGERTLVDVNALVEEYAALSYHGMRAQQTGLDVAIERDYDAAAGSIEAVPQEIGRVLLNLVNNALYAVHARSRQAEGLYLPTVRVSTRRRDDVVQIRVWDNGDGIPEPVRERIFEPFFTTKPAGEGTGLGLSLAYDIVTKGHGGTLTVESTAGAGTEFVVELPSQSGDAPVRPAAARHDEVAS